MTEKLYEKNAYTDSFEAVVTGCEAAEGGFDITLDKTAFFPEGGGQRADSGFIEDAEISDVLEEQGEIYHKASKALPVGAKVKCRIDWKKRFYRMQNHTGEHLLSGLIHKTKGFNNVGFHMGRDAVTLDLDGVITPEDIEVLEEAANQAIYENVPVRAYIPSPEELKKLNVRSKIDLREGIRVVEITGYDCCACCAPHVSSTGEIGMVKIIDSCSYKGGTRLSILCGHDALVYFRNRLSENDRIKKILSCPGDKTVETLEKYTEAQNILRAENRSLKDRLALSGMEASKAGEITLGFLKTDDFEDIRTCINSLSAKNSGIVAVFSQPDETSGCIFAAASDKSDIAPFVTYLRSSLGAKCGGKGNYVQGKIIADKTVITEKIKNYKS